MFTAVTAKIEGRAETLLKGDIYFAAFLLFVLAVPYWQLLLLLGTTLLSGQCVSGSKPLMVDADAWWLLLFHLATVAPLIAGAVYWLWHRSTIGRRFASPIPVENVNA